MFRENITFQKTLKKPISFEGIGLHKGEYSLIHLLPSDENTGIMFEFDNKVFPVSPKNVCDTLQNITLCFNSYKIMTVEHLFSVFVGLGIDNVVIKVVSGSEIPILEGSAQVFVEKVLEVGTVQQSARRNYLFLGKEYSFYKNEDQYIIARPSDRLVIDYEVEFEVIGKESIRIEINEENYVKEISRARTFGFLEDAEKLKKAGLALGASMENVHVYSRAERKSLNGDRYHNENVRHKVLDLLGAIALTNPRVVGEFIARKSGHYIDCKLIMNIVEGESKEEGKIV
ncbi:MAG: UDP-3-O-acyl-N-acetylglucosamine deacetylase [Brevinematia bacterium]